MVVNPETHGESLVVRGRTTERGGDENRGRSKSKSKTMKCYYCKKKSHVKAESFKLKNRTERSDQNGKMLENSGEASVIKDVEDLNNQGDLIVIFDSRVNSTYDWILDTACTFHMTYNREWFTTYELRDMGTVLMGNDVPCKIIDIGTVRVKMHDGIIRTLEGVRHIPDLG